MEIKVSEYRKELSERWEQSIRQSTQDKYLRAIRKVYEANGQVFEWRPGSKFIDGHTRDIFEMFIKMAILYGFSEGTIKLSKNFDQLEKLSQQIEKLWIVHKPLT